VLAVRISRFVPAPANAHELVAVPARAERTAGLRPAIPRTRRRPRPSALPAGARRRGRRPAPGRRAPDRPDNLARLLGLLREALVRQQRAGPLDSRTGAPCGCDPGKSVLCPERERLRRPPVRWVRMRPRSGAASRPRYPTSSGWPSCGCGSTSRRLPTIGPPGGVCSPAITSRARTLPPVPGVHPLG
jgi:hypothetical protein